MGAIASKLLLNCIFPSLCSNKSVFWFEYMRFGTKIEQKQTSYAKSVCIIN